MKLVVKFFLMLGLLACLGARAADPVTEAINQAYAPYRAALFRTNSKAQAESEQAMAQARQAWQAILDRFAAQPSVPYDRDPEFRTSLNAVAKVYEQAAAEVGQGKLVQAHETLEQARDIMAELRRRNGVVVFSDHMNAYHAEMEHVLQQGPAMTSNPQAMLTLVKRVGVLEYLAQRLRSEAPKALQSDAEFGAALQALEISVAELQRAAMNQDAAAAREALGRLKGPYSRMFLKFG
jgi:flagellin-specific chaperone FliS